MSPISAEYSINGEVIETAEAPDNRRLVFSTPVGEVHACLKSRDASRFSSPLPERFYRHFPGDSCYDSGNPLYGSNNFYSIFEVRRFKRDLELRKISVDRRYAINDGELHVELTAYDLEDAEYPPSLTDRLKSATRGLFSPRN